MHSLIPFSITNTQDAAPPPQPHALKSPPPPPPTHPHTAADPRPAPHPDACTAAAHSIEIMPRRRGTDPTIAEADRRQGRARMWRRPDAERGGPAREAQARAEAADFRLPARA